VRGRGSFAEGQAEAAITATLDALGAALLPSERRTFVDVLASDLASVVLAAHAPKAPLDTEGFYRRVQRHEAVRAGRAREHAQIVCRSLGELLPAESIQLLIKRLSWIEPLLRVEEMPPAPPPPEVLRRREPTNERDHDTLASGRPGSKRPLSG
jgi:hypothetical protein